jgi:hypothetical protein
MKKLIFIIIGLTISISVMAEAHGVNLLAQSPTVTPSPFVTDKTGKASESKGNVLPHNQRGSNSNLKRSQRTPLPSYKSQINQTQANNPYNRSLDNQNYNNNPGFESKGNVLPHNQRGSNSNLKRGQHTPLSTNQPRANSPYSGNLINQNYSNNPGPKRGRNIFTGRDQSKLNQGNARPRSHRD